MAAPATARPAKNEGLTRTTTGTMVSIARKDETSTLSLGLDELIGGRQPYVVTTGNSNSSSNDDDLASLGDESSVTIPASLAAVVDGEPPPQKQKNRKKKLKKAQQLQQKQKQDPSLSPFLSPNKKTNNRNNNSKKNDMLAVDDSAPSDEDVEEDAEGAKNLTAPVTQQLDENQQLSHSTMHTLTTVDETSRTATIAEGGSSPPQQQQQAATQQLEEMLDILETASIDWKEQTNTPLSEKSLVFMSDRQRTSLMTKYGQRSVPNLEYHFEKEQEKAAASSPDRNKNNRTKRTKCSTSTDSHNTDFSSLEWMGSVAAKACATVVSAITSSPSSSANNNNNNRANKKKPMLTSTPSSSSTTIRPRGGRRPYAKSLSSPTLQPKQSVQSRPSTAIGGNGNDNKNSLSSILSPVAARRRAQFEKSHSSLTIADLPLTAPPPKKEAAAGSTAGISSPEMNKNGRTGSFEKRNSCDSDRSNSNRSTSSVLLGEAFLPPSPSPQKPEMTTSMRRSLFRKADSLSSILERGSSANSVASSANTSVTSRILGGSAALSVSDHSPMTRKMKTSCTTGTFDGNKTASPSSTSCMSRAPWQNASIASPTNSSSLSPSKSRVKVSLHSPEAGSGNGVGSSTSPLSSTASHLLCPSSLPASFASPTGKKRIKIRVKAGFGGLDKLHYSVNDIKNGKRMDPEKIETAFTKWLSAQQEQQRLGHLSPGDISKDVSSVSATAASVANSSHAIDQVATTGHTTAAQCDMADTTSEVRATSYKENTIDKLFSSQQVLLAKSKTEASTSATLSHSTATPVTSNCLDKSNSSTAASTSRRSRDSMDSKERRGRKDRSKSRDGRDKSLSQEPRRKGSSRSRSKSSSTRGSEPASDDFELKVVRQRERSRSSSSPRTRERSQSSRSPRDKERSRSCSSPRDADRKRSSTSTRDLGRARSSSKSREGVHLNRKIDEKERRSRSSSRKSRHGDDADERLQKSPSSDREQKRRSRSRGKHEDQERPRRRTDEGRDRRERSKSGTRRSPSSRQSSRKDLKSPPSQQLPSSLPLTSPLKKSPSSSSRETVANVLRQAHITDEQLEILRASGLAIREL